MKRTPIKTEFSAFPTPFHDILKDARLYDSSCSPEAQVVYIEKDNGYFLKCAPRGMLKKEAVMGDFFHQKGLSPAVLSYLSEEKDWLLTERARGEDATHALYLSDPRRLSATMGELLRALHELPYADCPVADHTTAYLSYAKERCAKGFFDGDLFGEHSHFKSAADAARLLEREGHILKRDTLLHGDYCLPNILFDDWRFSALIDLGNGGVGDRHIDLFWGAWTLNFNLGTDLYRDRFFDAYGRDLISKDALLVVEAAEASG